MLYLFFDPLISSEYFIYEKTSFREIFANNDSEYSFKNKEAYYEDEKLLTPSTICLPNKFNRKDLLNIQGGNTFYISERIINQFIEENILGYRIIDKGDSLVKLCW